MKEAFWGRSKPAPLDTQAFVQRLGSHLQSYGTAANGDVREAAVAAGRAVFAEFERTKTGGSDPASLGARFGDDKLDSLTRKLAKIEGYHAHQGVAASFVQRVSPALGARLGLVGELTEELRQAKAAHQAAENALQQARAEAELVAAGLIESSTRTAKQEADAVRRAAYGEVAGMKSELAEMQQEVAALRDERDALDAACDAIAEKQAAFFSAIPSEGVGFTTGGVVLHVSKSALEQPSYLSAIASGKYQEQPDRTGAIKISDITPDELRAVIDFLEKDKISDVESFGQERLLDVALRFGSDEMISYVKDPAAYRKEQQRLARLREVGGVGAIPEGYVAIPAGEFTMGSPAGEAGRRHDEVQHEVHITKPFFLKKTPVRQAEFHALMGYNPSHFQDGVDAGQRPVESVSFYEAVWFCNKLSEQQDLEPFYTFERVQGQPGQDNFYIGKIRCNAEANGYHLPTEAQWEYAARAGSTDATHGPRDEVAWFDDNSGRSTHAVGQKAANAWGLHDMLGNVYEWVWNRYGTQGGGHGVSEDPRGPDTGSSRVYRGGCWYSPARSLRAAVRNCDAPDGRYAGLGFRPARSID